MILFSLPFFLPIKKPSIREERYSRYGKGEVEMEANSSLVIFFQKSFAFNREISIIPHELSIKVHLFYILLRAFSTEDTNP